MSHLQRLPDLPAAAAMANLRTAMFFDPGLKAMVKNLAIANDGMRLLEAA